MTTEVFDNTEEEENSFFVNWFKHSVSLHIESSHIEHFWGTTKKCENKNLSYFSPFIRDRDGTS